MCRSFLNLKSMKHVYWSIISEHGTADVRLRSFPCLSILALAGEHSALDSDDIHNLYQLVQLWPFTSCNTYNPIYRMYNPIYNQL